MATYLLKLPDAQLDALRDLSRRTGVPVAQLLRGAANGLLSGGAPGGVRAGVVMASGSVVLLKVN